MGRNRVPALKFAKDTINNLVRKIIMKEIRLGMIGVGGIAKSHMSAIRRQQEKFGDENGRVKFVIAVDVVEDVAKRCTKDNWI